MAFLRVFIPLNVTTRGGTWYNDLFDATNNAVLQTATLPKDLSGVSNITTVGLLGLEVVSSVCSEAGEPDAVYTSVVAEVLCVEVCPGDTLPLLVTAVHETMLTVAGGPVAGLLSWSMTECPTGNGCPGQEFTPSFSFNGSTTSWDGVWVPPNGCEREDAKPVLGPEGGCVSVTAGTVLVATVQIAVPVAHCPFSCVLNMEGLSTGLVFDAAYDVPDVLRVLDAPETLQ